MNEVFMYVRLAWSLPWCWI